MLTGLIEKLLLISLLFCLTGLIGCGGEQRHLTHDSVQARDAMGTNPAGSVQEAGPDGRSPGESAGPAATSGGVAGSKGETASNVPSSPNVQTSRNVQKSPNVQTPRNVQKTSPNNVPSPPGSDVGQDEAATQQSSSSISFQEDIRPLFEKRCMMCHKYTLHRIQWTEYDESMQYVNSGQLLERVWNLQDMPPPGMEMTEEERELVKDWIEGGAPP